MTKTQFSYALWIILTAVPVQGQETKLPEKPAQSLANWWLNSSLFYDPMPTKYLTHLEGTASYSNSQGNVDGSMTNLTAELDVRKHRLTNRFNIQHMRQDTNYGPTSGVVRTTQSTLRNRLDFDLNKRWVLVGGVENYRDSVLMIDQRFSVFGGFGFAAKPETRHSLNFTGGLAYSHFDFDDRVLAPALARNGIMIGTTPSSAASLFLQSWRWQMTKTVTLTQQGLFIDYFNKDLGRRWSGSLDLNVPIMKHISLAVGYTIKSEINRYTTAMGVKPQDRNFTTGIRVTL